MNTFNKKLTINLIHEQVYNNSNESQELNDSPEHQQHENESFNNNHDLLKLHEFPDGGDSEFGDNRNETSNSKINFVEFEEFNLNSFEPKEKNKTHEDKSGYKNKRNVVIEVPDQDEQLDSQFRNIQGAQSKIDIPYENHKFKEPLAPSKGSRHNKVFVFPTNPANVNQKDNSHEERDIEEMKRYFERERQEFYVEKSRLEKEILIKNGQIEMLHKLLTETMPKNGMNEKSTLKCKSKEINETNEEYENIILNKDMQICELLEKIEELNNILMKKNEEIYEKIREVNLSTSRIHTLKNQLFIYEQKEHNHLLTKKFYEIQKEKLKAREEEFMMPIDHRGEFGFRGLESLHKRIEMVRMNRMGIEFESKNKTKSNSSYSQTTKNRPKGVFDFKEKTFEVSNMNKTRMY